MAGAKERHQQKEHKEKILHYQEALKENPDDIPTLLKIAKAYYSADNYEQVIEYSQKILAIDHANVDVLHILSYAYYYTDQDDKAIDHCTQWLARDIQSPTIPLAVLNRIYEQKARREEQARLKEEHARLIEQAKVEERNKIIADLSHSIKNLISTVIDPLENLKKYVTPDQKRAIENALRGTNLVRETVNAMNLSSKGGIEDFYHDAKYNTGKDGFNLQTMCIESLKYSVGNMFDGKYFSNFMRKYFPTRERYIEAKSEWDNVSQAEDISLLLSFLQEYFFDAKLRIHDAENSIIGNEKGSAIKLLILFQEIVLNAVKYSAFVAKEKRLLNMYFSNDNDHVSIKVENRFKPDVKTKSSGLGHVIIENFAKLINTQPILNKENDIYSVEIVFENFWQRERE